MIYVKFLSAACAIGATLTLVAAALRTTDTTPDGVGAQQREALKASRFLH